MRTVAPTFLSVGLGGMIALGTQAPNHPWGTAWWLALFAASGLAIIIGLWAVSHIFAGWPPALPTHAERQAKKAQKAYEDHVARVTWQESFQELIDELEG